MSYVFRFPREIEQIIHYYVMGFGTKLARLFRKTFHSIPMMYGKQITWWRLYATLRGRMCEAFGIGYIELQIAYLTYDISRTSQQTEFEKDHQTYLKELTQLYFKKKYDSMTAPNTFGTPTAIIIRNKYHS